MAPNENVNTYFRNWFCGRSESHFPVKHRMVIKFDIGPFDILPSTVVCASWLNIYVPTPSSYTHVVVNHIIIISLLLSFEILLLVCSTVPTWRELTIWHIVFASILYRQLSSHTHSRTTPHAHGHSHSYKHAQTHNNTTRLDTMHFSFRIINV